MKLMLGSEANDLMDILFQKQSENISAERNGNKSKTLFMGSTRSKSLRLQRFLQ